MTEIIPVDKILQTNEASTDDDGHLATSLAVGEQADNELKQEEMAKFHWARCKSKWFVVDGLGITCAGITYGLIIFAEFVVVGVILLPEFPRSPWGYVHTVIFTCLAILAAAAHVRSMTTDPGAIPKGNFNEHNIKCLGYKPGDVVVRCTKCECIKLNRAHHCSTCQRCVRKMDHHCPWINNCVGEFNQKFFMLFTFYIMTISIYALGLSIRYIYSCSGNDWQDCAYFSPPATIIFIVFLVFEGLLFGIFTLVMFCTQFNAVVKDETGIEHLKKEKQEDDGTW